MAVKKLNGLVTISIMSVMICSTIGLLMVVKPGQNEISPSVVVETTEDETMTVVETTISVVEEIETEATLYDRETYLKEVQSSNPAEYTVMTPTNGRVYVELDESTFGTADWLLDLRVLKAACEDGDLIYDTTEENYKIYPDTYSVDGNKITVRVDFIYDGITDEFTVYVDKELRSIIVDV